MAFGSADHCVYYYDLRNTKSALNVFKGHKKAVSYVKFLNETELVSASTDSQLKLWSVGKNHCQRSFIGHTNERNFVGLATDGEYIVCGSENNSLYIYYKGLPKHALTFHFDSAKMLVSKAVRRARKKCAAEKPSAYEREERKRPESMLLQPRDLHTAAAEAA